MPVWVWHVQVILGAVGLAVAIPLIAYVIWAQRNERRQNDKAPAPKGGQ